VNSATATIVQQLKRGQGVAGAVQWVAAPNSKITHMKFVCPCGCGELDCIPVDQQPSEHGWTWNGDMNLPTLRPSLQRTGGCGWHGYLTDGIFKPC
jgi:hypothetical protein